MNLNNCKQLDNLLPATYIKQATDAAKSRENLIHQLIQHKKIPVEGWDEHTIEIFLNQLSAMDSNNFPSNCGVGEREARFASEIVARRHYRFGHGVGRSGDLTEVQPKAAGSSLVAKLSDCMTRDVLQLMGIEDEVACLIAPVATGMSLVLTMLTLRTHRPSAEYVIWSRIDQKACFKSILTAGFKPIIIDTVIVGDQLVTDTDAIQHSVQELGADNIVCILTTTSCFAPRACDSLDTVAKLCKEHAIPHVVNNAYGLQTTYCMRQIQKANRKGRVDVFVQSTDKNLMVPVGGTIVAGFNKHLVECISKIYPGRASSSPTLDAFITLLNIGQNGYRSLVKQREVLYIYLREKLSEIAEKYGERILETPNNPISIGMTLSCLKADQLTSVGAMLFIRNVSGARVITTRESKTISGYEFTGWGAHSPSYTVAYLTCASTIGMTSEDVDVFVKRLDKVLSKLNRRNEVPAS
ncbi:Sec synthetase [Carabus blaptoides fortunei]